MTRRFIVLVQGGTAEVRNAITQRLTASSLGYWHWMNDVWLVNSVEAGVSAKSFAEWLELTPGVSAMTYLVFSCDDNALDWYGRNTQAAWDWMNAQWH